MVELDFTNVFIDRHFVLSVVDGDFFSKIDVKTNVSKGTTWCFPYLFSIYQCHRLKQNKLSTLIYQYTVILKQIVFKTTH